MTQSNHLPLYSISFILFFVILLLSKNQRGNRLFDEGGMVSNQTMLSLLHFAGILLLGVVPFIFSGTRLDEIVLGKKPPADLPVLVSGLFVIVAAMLGPIASEKKFCMTKLKRPAGDSFTTGYIANYFVLRILFLIAYEAWFRGYLLTDCINAWGIVVAIISNIALYVLLHSVNGKDEMRGCVPLGLLLCFLCIWTGAAWPAIAIHIALAVSYEAHFVRRINKPSISVV